MLGGTCGRWATCVSRVDGFQEGTHPFVAGWGDGRSLASTLTLIPDCYSSGSLGLRLTCPNPGLSCTVLSPDRRSPQDAFYIDMSDPQAFIGHPKRTLRFSPYFPIVVSSGLQRWHPTAVPTSWSTISSALYLSALCPCLLSALTTLSSSARGGGLMRNSQSGYL